MADAMIFKPGDLPDSCTETTGSRNGAQEFQTTSNWLYAKMIE